MLTGKTVHLIRQIKCTTLFFYCFNGKQAGFFQYCKNVALSSTASKVCTVTNTGRKGKSQVESRVKVRKILVGNLRGNGKLIDDFEPSRNIGRILRLRQNTQLQHLTAILY